MVETYEHVYILVGFRCEFRLSDFRKNHYFEMDITGVFIKRLMVLVKKSLPSGFISLVSTSTPSVGGSLRELLNRDDHKCRNTSVEDVT